MNVFGILEDFTHQFIGGAFLRADIFRRCDDELHLQTLTQFKQRGDRTSIQSRCFIEEQQAARRDIFTAQAARFIFPALYHHHQNRHTGTNRLTGRQCTRLCAQPAIGTTVNLNFHFQIVAVIQQFFTDGLRRALPHINLRVKTLIQFRQRFREGQTVAVKQILMLLVLFREHIQ